ncbi:uncharacterized protein LOC106652334 [Trichogramma pretiosum]|uniref:uncharacterized protein LOC106652334 n=1 Tax=Trichogramma pretiosum TaxID=7493 RepID=UPI0006C94831|nr:uncharacterized protein LOC106652334 [Trichogramma pretiosum]XP_014226737.1 uncharacterized protein LOC106652334 [Trichogramma pretiosum]XP_014226745.1 uncharacterized protein LOC106652334 [Trichogramma pretiosum]
MREIWSDDEPEEMPNINQRKLLKLKRLRKKVNWEVGQERLDFLRQHIYPLVSQWEGELPNFRDVFWPEEIDCLISDSIKEGDKNHNWMRNRFINFMVRTGYKDEPKIDYNGKPIVRRTTPLHHLARSGYSINLFKELFEIYHTFTVNYVDDTGLTHFHVACMYDDVEIIEQFLLNGHDPNRVVPETGDTPLHLALEYNSCLAVYENLLHYGANPNLANKAGWTPLNIISDNDMMPMFIQLEVLFRPPLTVNEKGKLGRTPLEWAVRKGMPDVVNVLTEKGIDVPSFVFPAREDFSKFIQKCRKCWNSGKVRLASGLLSIVESLESKGFRLNRSTSMKIMKLFDEQELFENSSNVEESWYKDEGFAEEAKKIKIRSDLSLYDLTRLRPKEASKKLKYIDYYHFVSPKNVKKLSETYRKACFEHLVEKLSRQFFQVWALSPLMELIHFALSFECCELIVDGLMNRDLYNICLAANSQNAF